MHFASRNCEESGFLNLCASFEPHLCSAFINSYPLCPFLLPLCGTPLDCFTIYLCYLGNPTVWGWWLHPALVSRLKSFNFAGRDGIVTPGSAAVYLNPVSILRMTMSRCIHCFTELFINILSIFSWQKYSSIFLLILKACGIKNSQINKKSLRTFLLVLLN